MRKHTVVALTLVTPIILLIVLIIGLLLFKPYQPNYSFTSWQAQLQNNSNPCKQVHIDSTNETLCFAGYGVWVSCKEYHEDRACRELDN